MVHNREFQLQRFLSFWFLKTGFYCMLQREHVIRCNLPTTCLGRPLRDKLQEKLHRVALALGRISVDYRSKVRKR